MRDSFRWNINLTGKCIQKPQDKSREETSCRLLLKRHTDTWPPRDQRDTSDPSEVAPWFYSILQLSSIMPAKPSDHDATFKVTIRLSSFRFRNITPIYFGIHSDAANYSRTSFHLRPLRTYPTCIYLKFLAFPALMLIPINSFGFYFRKKKSWSLWHLYLSLFIRFANSVFVYLLKLL